MVVEPKGGHRKKLSEKQLRLLRILSGFESIGQSPSHLELAKILGVTQPAVTMMVQILANKGLIIYKKGHGRSIKLNTEVE